MEYRVVIETVIVMFLLMSVGYASGRLGVLSEHASHDLTKLLMNVAFPCMIFSAMLSITDDPVLLQAGLYCFGLTYLIFPLSWAVAWALRKVFRVPDGKKGIWIFCSAFSNCGFMGFPVAYQIFGAKGLFLAVMINLASQALFFTLGVKTISMDAQTGGKMEWKKILRQNTNYAILFGLFFIFTGISLPAPVVTTLGYLGNMTTPLSLFVVGLSLCDSRFRDVVKNREAFTATFMRLIFAPLMTFFLLKLFAFPPETLIAQVTVLIVAMPAPAISLIFSKEYGPNAETASSTIFISSLLCILTIPLIMLLF